MNATVISQNGAVIYTVTTDAKEVDIAGDVTVDGSPVNVTTRRVSRSKANAAAADKAGVNGLVQRNHNGRVFFVCAE